MRVQAVDACPGCAGQQWEALSLGAHALRRCTSCRLVYAAEVADPTDIYVDGYMTNASEFGPPDVTDPTFQSYLVEAGGRRLETIEGMIGRPASFVDVGCGTGDVLVAAKERGWSAVGVEPVEESVAIAVDRGINVRATMLEDSGLPERSFDIVSAFHVLEHMPEAEDFLRLLARWARPGGHVVIEVPNWGSLERRNKGADWPLLRPLEHVAHYEPATLAATLDRAGLADVRVRTLTFLSPIQTMDEALSDLGLQRFGRVSRTLSRATTRGARQGRFPRRSGWLAASGTAWLYDRFRVGQVVLGIGRVD